MKFLSSPLCPSRLVSQSCGINRVRVCPQQPHLVAFWGDNGQVRVLDIKLLLEELAGEQEATAGARAKQQVNGESMGGFGSRGNGEVARLGMLV